MNDLNTEVLEKSLETFGQHSNTLSQLQILIQLGRNYQAKRQYQKALNYFRQTLDLVKGQSNHDYRIIAKVNIGCVYWEMSQLKKAMGFFQEALPIIEKLGDDAGRRMLCATMGISYWRKGEWFAAFDWFKKALEGCQISEINTEQLIDPLKYGGWVS